ncbi:putative GMP synthase [Daphnia magna]|uniref:Putative GMP synthase n=1 Tax=Daphnia magna TaxID=35525 RepID=A0A162CZC1_9CRUS|nr:putative GMP synthase [Daphnia magna]
MRAAVYPYVRRTVGRNKIGLILVSGGLDSAVCPALLHKALLQSDNSSRVHDIHIDNGFLLALIPDLIESASHMAFSRADAIKTHQNDSEMVRQLLIYGRVVEPLKGLRSRAGSVHRITGTSPGLSIRIIYAEELFTEAFFVKTQVLIRFMVDYANMAAKEHVLLNRFEIVTSEEECLVLEERSRRNRTVIFRLQAFTKYQADPTSYDSFTYKCLAFRAATNSLYSRMLCLKLEFSYQRLAKFKRKL